LAKNAQNSSSNTLIFVSCTKSKQKYKCKAKELYSPSLYFKKSLKYAKKLNGQIKILSAKYGLIDPEVEI